MSPLVRLWWIYICVAAPVNLAASVILFQQYWEQQRWAYVAVSAFLAGVNAALVLVAMVIAIFMDRRKVRH